MISAAALTALLPVAASGLELVAAGIKKAQESGEINQYIDRAKLFSDLFDPDKRDDAYKKLYSEMLGLIARKGITPSQYWYDPETKQGAYCINIPIATLKELMDAATK